MAEKIARFEDLSVWQKAHQTVLCVYRVTGSFPAEERFGLTSQMRRAAVSVLANLAGTATAFRRGKPWLYPASGTNDQACRHGERVFLGAPLDYPVSLG